MLFDAQAWTLAAGGAIVGYLTNLIALKLIFEPVEPTRVGPFTLQGMFLRRQHEVRRASNAAPTPRHTPRHSPRHAMALPRGRCPPSSPTA